MIDGAATISGRENGFGVRLSEDFFGHKHTLFLLHCGAHRLHLDGRH